jgi:glycosyltransferase involved in cell wall biosynthesis
MIRVDSARAAMLSKSEVAEPEGKTPELTILVPTLNEEITVETFLDWCHEGIARAGVAAEIILVDGSSDSTPEKAFAKGARIVRASRPGLGRAYQEGIPFIRGKYVIMGDADCTYDFRELEPFIQKLRDGYEYVMGSRVKGYIEPGSMPVLHRYFGSPLTTWILNLVYQTHFSDIHCGMRAITKEALVRMELESESWQYASEMILKSVHMKLRTAEVPIRFFKDREGRLSHHKRGGWLTPWKAGWTSLEVMFTHGAEFFTIRPGIMLTALGLLFTLPLILGPIQIGQFKFSLYWMLLGLTLTVVGMQSVYVGCVTQILHDYDGESSRRLLRLFSYNRSVLLSAGLFVLGMSFMIPLLKEYSRLGFTLSGEIGRPHHMAIAGLLLMIIAFTNFVFTLVLHSTALRVHRRDVSQNR